MNASSNRQRDLKLAENYILSNFLSLLLIALSNTRSIQYYLKLVNIIAKHIVPQKSQKISVRELIIYC